jgi:hypothetical protein
VTARFFRVKLFLDLDGVLADFDRGVIGLTGRHPREQSAREMWRAVVRAPDFFAALAFTDDGKRLWEFCRPLDPTILTGLPHGGWADPQKRRWVTEMLGPDVPVSPAWRAGRRAMRRRDTCWSMTARARASRGKRPAGSSSITAAPSTPLKR